MPISPPTSRPRFAPSRIEQRRNYEAKRRAEKPWRALYKTAAWQGIRVEVLSAEPLCRRCTRLGLVVPATVVHHVDRHGGDPVKFFAGPFEPLCKPCHDVDAQREEAEAARGAARG